MADVSYADMMGRKRTRFVATGDTYPHRELFTSWAWHWDQGLRAWIEDNGSYISDIGVQVIKDLPGVIVKEEDMD